MELGQHPFLGKNILRVFIPSQHLAVVVGGKCGLRRRSLNAQISFGADH